MSRFNVENNHMIMPVNRDTAEYEEVQYYCSVHSEDRNVFKYPDSGSFEIEFPRDYLNVKTMTISEMAMPINNELFSTLFNNVYVLFRINEPYNPVETSGSTSDILQYTIFQALNARKEQDFIIQIENGYFSVDQMITELTRRMNDAVTEYITNYLSEFAPDLSSSFTSYDQFVLAYNYVNGYLWFGNRSSGFVFSNASSFFQQQELELDSKCTNRFKQKEYVNWGLPSNLGFDRVDTYSIPSTNAGKDVRFYYGDVVSGDNGYWLTPDSTLSGSSCYYVQPPFRLNIFGDPYVYLFIDGWNNIDKTYPFYPSEFTQTTNETNGQVEAAFGKISLGSTPIALTFVGGFFNPRVYDPPLNKMRKIKLTFRYHNGLQLTFGNMFFAMTFQFTCLRLKQKTT